MRHPYFYILHVLNAYDALQEFKRDLNENLQFHIFPSGLSQITKNMHEECIKNKCEFKLRTLFINSKYDENTKIFKNMYHHKDYEKFIIESKI